jgi:NitT/TauT family transport system substrate-binding protein
MKVKEVFDMKKLNLRAKLSGLLAASFLLSLLAGCSGSGQASSGAQQNQDAQTTQTQDQTQDQSQAETVAFDAEENTIHFGIIPGNIRVAVNILAQELGYYEEEGVNVVFEEIQDVPSALTAISMNKDNLDVWGVSIVPSLTFIANGSDLVIFEGTAAEGGAIISKPENVDHYKDLNNYQNITAAMVRNESSWLITRAKLVEQGIDVDSITLMELDSEANVAQAVAKGEADLGFLPVEKANSFLDIGTAIVYEAGELDPMYVCCRQVTSSQKYQEKYDAFVKYAAANLRALEYYEDEANRDAIISLLAEHSGQTEEYVNNYLFVNRTYLTQDPNASGVAKFYNSLADVGYFDDGASADITEHIDTSAYKQALDLLLERYPNDEFYQEQLEIYQTYNA